MPKDHPPKATVQMTATTRQKGPRLPCRGCLPDCANYERCNGLPWRLQRGDLAIK